MDGTAGEWRRRPSGRPADDEVPWLALDARPIDHLYDHPVPRREQRTEQTIAQPGLPPQGSVQHRGTGPICWSLVYHHGAGTCRIGLGPRSEQSAQVRQARSRASRGPADVHLPRLGARVGRHMRDGDRQQVRVACDSGPHFLSRPAPPCARSARPPLQEPLLCQLLAQCQPCAVRRRDGPPRKCCLD